MVQAAWEKPASAPGWEKSKNPELARLTRFRGRWKFMVGGMLILVAVAYLVISSTLSGARYFITVDEVVNNPDYIGKTVRISGAVIGDSIQYDSENLIIQFTISHIPSEFDNLADALHESVNNPDLARLPIYIENEVKPDLLQHEAQAILTGRLGEDGVFYATELLLKCPSRFEDGSPDGSLAEDHPGMQTNAG